MSAIQKLIDYVNQENENNYVLADSAAQELAALRSELEAVKASEQKMREALGKLEFIYFAYKMTMVKRCPVCGSPEGDTEHSFDTDCWLAATLKGGKG